MSRLDEIRAWSAEHAGEGVCPVDERDVAFLLAEIDRLTAERDEARDRLLNARDPFPPPPWERA